MYLVTDVKTGEMPSLPAEAFEGSEVVGVTYDTADGQLLKIHRIELADGRIVERQTYGARYVAGCGGQYVEGQGLPPQLQ